jgi:hypothetical protein
MTRSDRVLLERAPHAGARCALDLISKHVVAHTEVVASPSDDARPSNPAEEVAAWAAPSRARHPASDDPRKRPQKSLERLAATSPNQEVKMCSHVRKVVDPDPEATGHRSKRVAHGSIVLAEGQGTSRPMTRKDDVHGAAHADGALELATVAPDSASVLGARELGMDVASEKRALHDESSIANGSSWGNVFMV